MNRSRNIILANLFVGLVLFGFVMYPVLSSAQTLREKAQMGKDTFAQRLDLMREKRSEMVESKREDFHKRLAELKDQTKAKLAEHLAEQMNALNERLTNTDLNFLNRLQAILDKISERVAGLDASVDATTVKAKITAASDSIAAAKDAVLTQQAKVYDVMFTSEDKLRDAFQGVKKLMQDDHAALRSQLAAAKKAVQDAFAALKSLVKE